MAHLPLVACASVTMYVDESCWMCLIVAARGLHGWEKGTLLGCHWDDITLTGDLQMCVSDHVFLYVCPVLGPHTPTEEGKQGKRRDHSRFGVHTPMFEIMKNSLPLRRRPPHGSFFRGDILATPGDDKHRSLMETETAVFSPKTYRQRKFINWNKASAWQRNYLYYNIYLHDTACIG